MNPLQTINHFIKNTHHYLASAFDTEGDALFKRNILTAAFIYTIALMFQIAHIVQYFSGNLPEAVFSMVLVSILVLLSGFYLLVVKKRRWLAIYLLVIYLIIKQNVMMSMNLSDLPMLSIAWSHVAAFGLVFMLGAKRSIVPVFIYSGGLILQIFLGLENSADDAWDIPRFSQYISIHGITLCVAYFNEWSMAKAYQERDEARDEARELERKNAEEHARHVEELLENKKQLLADTAHELRAPLTVLKADIEAMEDGLSSQEESYPVLHRKLEQINHLIEDIYLISQADNQPLMLQHETIALSGLGHELHRSFFPLAKTKGLKLTLEKLQKIDHRIEGDWHRLLQVFGNLLQNSIHYTDAGGQIEAVPTVVASGVEIAIHDSSPGVPEQEQQRLFERFFRKSSSRNRAADGSGLGLTICKVIIEAHGGTINIAPSPLGGLAVTSFLPFTQTDNNTPL